MSHPRVLRARAGRGACLAVGALLAALLVTPPLAAQDTGDVAPVEPAPVETATVLTQEPTGEVTIGDSELADLAENPTKALPGTEISIEVHGIDLARVRDAVAAVGGTSYGEVPGFFVEARVPVDQLQELSDSTDVGRVARVTRSSSSVPQLSRSLQASTALTDVVQGTLQLDAWHNLGHKGAGQRIGILDVFGTDELERAIAAGRVPTPAGAFCRRFGTSCPLTGTNAGPHGVGVAEIIHSTAPDAQLYLATVTTLGDLTAAIDWFAAQGVTVVNRSETSEFDGAGDGTGPLASLVDRAINNDMVWVAAAGNAGGDAAHDGQNWIGTFNDPDGNGFHNWASGEERMEFTCGFLLGMRWDDWGTSTIATDYNLFIYDGLNDVNPEAAATNRQSVVGHLPLERIGTRCSGTNDMDYLSIRKVADAQPDGPDQIQIMGNFTPMEEWVNAGSATGPGADSANPGSITVGATEHPTSLKLAWYSSQGPTLDGRMNPDLLGPSCLPVTEFVGCFNGTSASAPVVTGVLAVLRAANVVLSASGADAVIPRITSDQGTPGPDSQYGHGSLLLPSPAAMGARDTLPLCKGLPATVVGTPGDDVLEGTTGPDVIFAGRGNDIVFAFGGNDVICTGFGDDFVDAGPGADTVFSGPGNDRVRGRDGADVINGGHGHDDIEGNQGPDEIRGYTGRDYVKGGLGDDSVFGGAGNDRLVGGDGVDEIFGGNGFDRCRVPVEFTFSCTP
jgi:Ca2+-binding RTX toxin-like protein